MTTTVYVVRVTADDCDMAGYDSSFSSMANAVEYALECHALGRTVHAIETWVNNKPL